MVRRAGFTLLEMLIVLTIFFFVIAITLQAYLRIVDVKNGVDARQSLIQNTYFMMERLQSTMKNYTIDYEEYFNRRMVGCDTAGDADGNSSFVWTGGSNGYCDRFTAYGNWNSLGGSLQGTIVSDQEHRLYYCSSVLPSDETQGFYKVKSIPGIVNQNNFVQGSGCYQYGFSFVSNPDGFQSFGQYAANFIDAYDDVDFVPSVLFDDDDIDLGKGPEAIIDPQHVQELYLISQDKTHKILLRRKLIESGDWDLSGTTGDVPTDLLYTIQILKLRGFDAGHLHDFDVSHSTGVYDGTIDTWACDFEEGFLCGDSNRDGVVTSFDNYDSISSIYSGFVMPLHEDDGWVDLFGSDLTVKDRNIALSPSKDPHLAWDEDDVQINPHITVMLDTLLYGKKRKQKVGGQTLDNYDMRVQTSFDVHSFY